jgi:LmbE family N-acetylglucosaminyl deacetylase
MRFSMLTLAAVIGAGLLVHGHSGGNGPDTRACSIAQHACAFPAGADDAPVTTREARKNSEDDKDGRDLGAAGKTNSVEKRKPLRILVIGAHPADVFDQSGGTMAHHVKRGDWVGCVVMTHGARVHDKVVADDMFHRKETPDAKEMKRIIAERAKVKEKEILRACSILGVRDENVYFLGADDTVLLVNEPMIRRLGRLFRKLRPDVVITHFPLENANVASQHAACGQMVMHGVNLAAKVEPGDKSPPHKITQVFFFGCGAAPARTHLWAAQGGFYNNVIIDITDVAAKKVACLNAVASQGYAGAYAKKRIETTDGAFGNEVKIPYAEGFISLYSPVHYYLPVSELSRKYINTSDHEAIERGSYRVPLP